MSASHALLGILVRGPAHGYDLKREHDARFPGTKPLAYGQVYSTLTRLQRDGFVEVAEVAAGGGPERTVYAITAQGEVELAGWLEQVEQPGPYAADDLVRKTVTALNLGADAGRYLHRQRLAHMARMRDLVSVHEAATDSAARIALDHTIAHLDADLQWLELAATRVASERKASL